MVRRRATVATMSDAALITLIALTGVVAMVASRVLTRESRKT